jgi:hypothetical protein
VVLRKIEYWHQGSISSFKIMCRDGKGLLGRSSLGRQKKHPSLLHRKPMREKVSKKLLDQK